MDAAEVVNLYPDDIRFGEPVDEQQVKMLLMLAHAENSIFKWDVAKSEWFIRRLLYTRFLSPADQGPRGCFGVIGPSGGTLEGLTMMTISSQWYSNAQYLEEFIVYVHPEYRRKNHASRLIDWMTQISEKLGIPLLTGVISQTRTEAKCRLYARKLTPVGQFFMHFPTKNPRWESEAVMSQLRKMKGMTTPSSSAAA